MPEWSVTPVRASSSAASSAARPATRGQRGRCAASAASAPAAARRADVDAEPAQRLGLPPPRAVLDPGQAHEVALPAGDQVGERAPGEVRRGDAVADVAAGRRRARCARSKRTGALPVAGHAERPAPVVRERRRRRARGTARGPPRRASSAPARRCRTRGSIRDPKWYGAPRPPKAMRPSAVRWP